MGANGMVSSAHPLASAVGVRVLADGGNAFDAAVATAVTLNVVEPYMSGVGGVGVALAYLAKEGRIRALNFSGRAPKAAEPDRFTDESKQFSTLASLVPGNLDGWLTLHQRYGSLDVRRLFQPAIDYAENGFPITYFGSATISMQAHLLMSYPDSDTAFLDGTSALVPGTRIRQPHLADTLRQIVEGGRETFYRGELAHRIVKGNQELGGLFTEDDFAEYQSEWQDPIYIDYCGYQVFTTPPNSSAFQVLQTLKLMEIFEVAFQNTDTVHYLMEVIKLCITDRIEYAGDPDYVRAPLKGLLSGDYAQVQKERINLIRTTSVSGESYARPRPIGALRPGSPQAFDAGMTTHFATADHEGNVVTISQTLGGGFGCGAIASNTGVFLNNMASYFDLDEESPNRIGPGKRVDFVVAPTQITKDGDFFMSMGTPGSWGILQTTPQVLLNVLEFGMNVQQAIEAPRFRYFAGRHVKMEERFPVQLRRQLEAKGHQVEVIEGWSRLVGGAQGILIDVERGTFHGGADPRRDGLALGL